MRLSVQKKAIAGISVLMVALAFSLMAVSLYHIDEAIRDELLTRGRIAANSLAHNASYATLIADTTTLNDLLDGMMAEKEVLYARVVDSDGQSVIAARGRAGDGAHPDASGEWRAMPHPGVATTDTEIVSEGNGMVRFSTPITIFESAEDNLSEIGIYDMSEDRGTEQESTRRIVGYAQAGMTTEFIEATIDNLQRTMLWTTLLALLFAMLLTSIMVRLGIKPINELVVATGRVASGDYDVKVTTPVRNDEVGDLAASFNKMTVDLKASRRALVEKELLEDLVQELKETQQQLIQAGKMAAIGQLAAGVAHEINNPLAGIMGYAQLATEHIRTRSQTGIPPSEIIRFAGYVENMEKQSQRCKQIVQNLLRFARSSTLEEPEPVDVNAVMRETLSFLSHQMVSSGVELDLRLASVLPPVKGHPGKMQQIFTNILINAVHAIKTDTGRVHVETSVKDNWITIRLSDSGEGIPPENLDKIFEPFFTTKEIGQGTGLGLSVTYGLVKDMGGTIAVSSVVGQGTTFTLSFPVMDRMDSSGPATTTGTKDNKEASANAGT